MSSYDELVEFDPQYAKRRVWFDGEVRDQVDVPDYVETVGEKNGLELKVSCFVSQPMMKVGDVEGEFISTSYLVGPEKNLGDGLFLPDIDIIEMTGPDGKKTLDAVFEIAKFYQNVMGWQPRVDEGFFNIRHDVDLFSNRFRKPQSIADVERVLALAAKMTNYDLENLCFKSN